MVALVLVLAAALAFGLGLLLGLRLAISRAAVAEAATQTGVERGGAAVAALLAPVRESLSRVDAQLAAVESSRREAYGGLLAQVESMRLTQDGLRTETAQLVGALRAPQVRGRWGEMQLRRVVEAAGALEHVHFREQVSLDTDDGRQRPDLVVDLSGGKQVAVDAKVPFEAWLRALEARDETQRRALMVEHARQLRAHVTGLGAKAYWSALGASPEFVVLFVPSDSFLDAALQADPTLLEAAFTRDVVLATPATLVALLRTIAFCWRSDRLAANTEQVSRLGRELHERLGTLGGHVGRLGGALSRAVEAYNASVATLETRVLVSARRFGDLQGAAPLIGPEPVDAAVRPLTAAELLDPAVAGARDG